MIAHTAEQAAQTCNQRLAELARAGLAAVVTDDGIAASSAAGFFHHFCGRDAIITALQLIGLGHRMLADPTVASWLGISLDDILAIGERTLHTLASTQGERVNPWNEEEPGKIIHEWVPNRPEHFTGRYYAANDATALFLILVHDWCALAEQVDERRAWTLRTALEENRDRALAWYFRYGDLDGDGFVEYIQRHPERLSLINQNWKDSRDSLLDACGELPRYPVRYAEVQGYWYRALRSEAAQRPEPERSALQAQADRIQAAFNVRFWLPEQGTYAQALDADGRPLADVTSNVGHCLWSGICAEEQATLAARRLLEPDLLTPFGIRTLSSRSPNFQPTRYHRGTIWPVDNWFAREALRARGWLDAARAIDTAVARALLFFGTPLELYVLHEGATLPEWYRSRPDATTGDNLVQAWTIGYCFHLALDGAPSDQPAAALAVTAHTDGRSP